MRGTLDTLGLAESPPHPDHICDDPTSPRKRGEVKKTSGVYNQTAGALAGGGHVRSAISAILRNCARLVPPAACTAMPCRIAEM